jgi:hypothetical protein
VNKLLLVVAALIFGIALLYGGPGAYDDRDLQLAEQQWYGSSHGDYRWTLEWMCFCGFAGPYTIDVEGDEPVRVNAYGDRVKRAGWPPLLTVGDVFQYLHGVLAKGPDKLSVDYDPLMGYPTSISIDYRTNAIDDEIAISATQFVEPGS